MSILNSKKQCRSDYGIVIKKWEVPDFNVETIPIESLYTPHNLEPDQTLVKFLVEDIPRNGLMNPLVTHKFIRNYRDKDENGIYLYDRQLTGSCYWGSKFQGIPYSEHPQYIVGYGNCRLEAAKKLGCTSIDCIVLDTFNVKHLKNLGKMLASYKEID